MLGPTTVLVNRVITPWSCRALFINKEIHKCHDHVPDHFFLESLPSWLPPSGGYSCGIAHGWALGCLEMLRRRCLLDFDTSVQGLTWGITGMSGNYFFIPFVVCILEILKLPSNSFFFIWPQIMFSEFELVKSWMLMSPWPQLAVL